MATFLNPYLHFEGVARDAITFYASVFGGEPSVMTYGEMGMDGPDAGEVMHSQLDRRDVGVQVMASGVICGRPSPPQASKSALTSSAVTAPERAPSPSTTWANSSALRAFSSITFSSMVSVATRR